MNKVKGRSKQSKMRMRWEKLRKDFALITDPFRTLDLLFWYNSKRKISTRLIIQSEWITLRHASFSFFSSVRNCLQLFELIFSSHVVLQFISRDSKVPLARRREASSRQGSDLFNSYNLGPAFQTLITIYMPERPAPSTRIFNYFWPSSFIIVLGFRVVVQTKQLRWRSTRPQARSEVWTTKRIRNRVCRRTSDVP